MASAPPMYWITPSAAKWSAINRSANFMKPGCAKSAPISSHGIRHPSRRQKRRRILMPATFRRRPRIYKAGRYGFGPATPRILAELGYEVDLSILPLTDLRTSSGPDYRANDAKPFWFGECPHLLEVPMSVGYLGALSSCGPKLYGFLNSDWGKRIHLPGIFARLHLLD